MTNSVEAFQLSVEAAEVYESSFVPALFAEWAPHLVEAAGVAPGQAVLDVACGTGVVARTVAVQVWDRLEAQEGYGAMYRAFREQLGPEAMELESGYWSLGDLELMGSLFQAAGLRITGTRTRVGAVRFASAAKAVATEIEATPLAERIDPDSYDRVLAAASAAMRPFLVDGERVELPIAGHLIVGTRKGGSGGSGASVPPLRAGR